LSRKKFLNHLITMNRFMRNKILTIDSTVQFRNKARDKGETVVFTNGCFDIIHRGHVDYLEEARSFGDVLIVGVNSDKSVRRIKPDGRPVIPEKDRAVIVAAFESVDVVCLFDGDTPVEIIKILKPDVLVKGAEYEVTDIAGHEQVLADGGKVVPVKMIPERSTSAIIKKIKEIPG